MIKRWRTKWSIHIYILCICIYIYYAYCNHYVSGAMLVSRRVRNPWSMLWHMTGRVGSWKDFVNAMPLPGCQWPSGLHPWRLTWNIIMEVWTMIFLSNWVICRFHVNLPGCIWYICLFNWNSFIIKLHYLMQVWDSKMGPGKIREIQGLTRLKMRIFQLAMLVWHRIVHSKSILTICKNLGKADVAASTIEHIGYIG